MKFTLSVRSRHVPATPGTSAWPPSLPSVPTSRATRVTSSANDESWSTIVLIVSASAATSPFASTVIFFDRSPLATAVVTWAMPRTWSVRVAAALPGPVRGHAVDVLGQALPRAGHAGDLGLAAELALGADLARDARHLRGERAELVDHRVDGVLQLEDLAARVDGDLLAQVAGRDGRRHRRDVAHLVGQVARHQVHVLGEVAPRAGDAGDLGLATELALGADLARDARDLVGERAQLVDHRVDRVLELQDLALDVHGDLLRQVALCHRRRDLGDVAHLVGEVRGHEVDVVGQVLPRAGDARHEGLPAEAAVGADLARDARDLVREGAELVDHRVDGVLELVDLALGVDRDLRGQVALGHGGRHLGDVADLRGQVRGHRVDVVGQVLPRAGDAGDLGLAAELALGADLARDAGHLLGEHAQRVRHRVDCLGEGGDLAARVDG